MAEIKVENIVKVIDVSSRLLDPATVKFFHHSEADYRDQVMKEHLYNITDVDTEEVLPVVKNEVEALQKLAEENDAAYLRIIF
jgi:hypothetical protein